MIQIALLLAVVLTACACSVKEDRAECPCWLKVYIDPFPGGGAVVSAYDSGLIFSSALGREDWSGYYEATVPREFVGVTCHNVLEGHKDSGSLYRIVTGNQADSLYAHHAMVDCTGEGAEDHARLHKQFATVYMTFENEGGEERCPYDVRISGNVNGMDMTTLSPHGGEFEYAPEELQPMFYQFRLPRQKDSSLSLCLYNKEDGELLDSLPLGEYIRTSGFDWNAEDLNDIVINVDFAKIGLEVNVQEWNAMEVYDVTI